MCGRPRSSHTGMELYSRTYDRFMDMWLPREVTVDRYETNIGSWSISTKEVQHAGLLYCLSVRPNGRYGNPR
jgi:hypothetical protein